LPKVIDGNCWQLTFRPFAEINNFCTMRKEKITFNDLPEAVEQMFQKLEQIENLLSLREVNSSDEDELLTIEQASELLHLAKPTIYAMVSRNEIPFSKRSKRLYFSKTDLKEWINSTKKKSKQDVANDLDSFLSNHKTKKS
jgi:excisionase family DNA binding protein